MGNFAGARAWLILVLAMEIMPAARAATHSLSRLIDTVIQKGPDSQLPAHLSVILGVNHAERATAVKQAVVRDGTTVRTFNVCTAKHDEVVFISYDEQSRLQKVYLLSPAGILRKAVAYQAGAPSNERALDEAARDFASELKFWTDFEHRLKESK